MSTFSQDYSQIKAALKEALIELIHERRELFHGLLMEVMEEAETADVTAPVRALPSDPSLQDGEEEAVSSEISAFHRLHPRLLEQYAGEYIAIHDQRLVDHDTDKLALYRRIHERYPDQFVLMRRVEREPEPELHFRRLPMKTRPKSVSAAMSSIS